MKSKLICVASLFLAGLGFSEAATPLYTVGTDEASAQPITLSALVGTEQSDFFFTKNAAGSYVVFTGRYPYGKSTTLEYRLMYSTRVNVVGNQNFFFQKVTAYSPLKRIGLFRVPTGTIFDNFINAQVFGRVTDREIFHIPGVGSYMSTSGGAPVLLRGESAAYPFTGLAVRFPDEYPTNNSPYTEQFRILLGSTYPGRGSEPFISLGGAAGLLADLKPGATGSSPHQFTTWNKEVYFLATNPTSGVVDIYRNAVTSIGRVAPPFDISATLTSSPLTLGSTLVGCGAGLFLTILDGNGDGFLATTKDETNYTYTIAANGGYAKNPTQLTPAAEGSANDDTIGFSAVDTFSGLRRFGYYTSAGGSAVFPEVSNQVPGTTTNPTLITSAEDYYYFSASYGNTGPYLMRSFVGGTSIELLQEAISGNYITNAHEIVRAPKGNVYFTADATINSVNYTGILFTTDPSTTGSKYATPCVSAAGEYVVGAHNLRGVGDGATLFRLYFTAPVNATQNHLSAPATPANFDYGTKPWCLNRP